MNNVKWSNIKVHTINKSYTMTQLVIYEELVIIH